MTLPMTRWAREPCRPSSLPHGSHDHNCIPIRHWLRLRWLCVRCGRIFKEDTR